MKRRKNSALYSAIFMGIGQIYNGAYIQGITFLIIELIAIFNIPKIVYGIWGLISLGERSQKVNGFDIIQGDHSVYLLVEGIVVVICMLIYVGIYIYNIKDAALRGHAKENGISLTKGKKGFKSFVDRNFKFIMLTPGIFGIVFFILLPLLITVAIAFTNYSAPDHIPPKNLVDWIGFGAFAKIFAMKIWQKTMFRIAVWNVTWAIIATVTTYSMGLLLALMTSMKGIKFQRFWRTIFILPYAIPAFVSLLVFRLLLNGIGPVNTFLISMGLDKIPFLTDPFYARLTVIIVNIWIGAPFFMVLLSGSLTNISKSLYEAAEIDGANSWQKFWHITLPMLLFQTAPVLIMQFAFNFNNFGAIYLLTEGKPLNSNLRYAGDTDILVSWLYKLTLNQNQYNLAGVISIILFAFVAIFSIYNFSRSKSFKEEGMM